MILPMTQKTNLSAADLIKPNPAPVPDNQEN